MHGLTRAGVRHVRYVFKVQLCGGQNIGFSPVSGRAPLWSKGACGRDPRNKNKSYKAIDKGAKKLEKKGTDYLNQQIDKNGEWAGKGHVRYMSSGGGLRLAGGATQLGLFSVFGAIYRLAALLSCSCVTSVLVCLALPQESVDGFSPNKLQERGGVPL